MTKHVVKNALILLCCIIGLSGCESLENEGGKDWVEVKVVVDQPEKNAANYSYSASGVLSAAIAVVPTSVTVASYDALTEAYDTQMQILADNTVTLRAPLNEKLKLLKAAYLIDYNLVDIVTNKPTPYALGFSEEFVLTAADVEKTLTVTMVPESNWQFVDGDGDVGINFDSTRGASPSQLLVFNSGLYATWSESAAISEDPPDGDFFGQIRVGLWDGSSSFNSGPVVYGLNLENSDIAEQPFVGVFDSKIYLIWVERHNSDNVRKVRLLSRDAAGSGPEAGGWTRLDGGGVNGLNYDITSDARLPNLLAFNSKLYIGWEERVSNVRQIRVAEIVGTVKTHIDGNGSPGINFGQVIGTCDKCGVKLVEFNSKLYAVWAEVSTNNNNRRTVHMAEWDGGSGWTFKDGNDDGGLNYNAAEDAEAAFPVVFNSKLYITWYENGGSNVVQIRVIEWDGTTWRFVDGNGANGINKDPAKNAVMPTLIVHNSKLYAAWAEESIASAKMQIRIAEWDGNATWTFVDGDEADGLNKDTTLHALGVTGVVYNSKMYLTWYEGWEDVLFGADPVKQPQIRVLQTGL
jgi:hypothetical protein